MILASLLLAASLPSGFPAYVESSMKDWKVPGSAVAVVRDGRVVMARGFGVVEAGKPGRVSSGTVFPIGSLSKSFTAAAIGTMVAEGKLAWDDPVAKHLPGFSVADPWVSRETTLRDLLAHRTGWQPEADLLWLGPHFGREEILSRIRHVGQGSGFRAGYTYTSVGYLVAAEAAARRDGTSWESLLRRRILEPLGLAHTYATLAEARAAGPIAASHSDEGGAARSVPAEDGDAVAPAAAMHASIDDMARWAIAMLDGAPALPEPLRRELTSPHNVIPTGDFFRRLYPESHFQSYGLGWVLQDYRGRKIVWNTGGMLGSACSIALVPELRAGVVVLTNGPRISFPEALVWRAIDDLLDAPVKDWSRIRLELSLAGRKRAEDAAKEADASRPKDTRPTAELSAYLGTYSQPLLGDLVVSGERDRLRLRLGTIAGTVEHWHHDVFRVTWDLAAYGTSMLEFTLDPDGVPSRLALEETGVFERGTGHPPPHPTAPSP